MGRADRYQQRSCPAKPSWKASWENRMPLFVLEPPVQYVHNFHGLVIERVLPIAAARKACAGKGVRADACAWTSNGACHLVIPRNGPVRNRAAYRRHEVAHCNGWEHSHAIAGRQDIEPH